MDDIRKLAEDLSLDNPLFEDFERMPATFDEFISNPYYLGKSWQHPWPFWVENGRKMFPLPLRSPYNSLILLGATGIGKSAVEGTKVLTPTGYCAIEKLEVGDLVASNDGKFYPVTGVFPQGKQPTYEIEFGYDIRCQVSDNHIWTVSRDYGRTYHEETTKEILEKGWQYVYKDTGWCQHHVELPKVAPLELPEAQLPIDPYLLGCLIGDGSITDPSMGFFNIDQEILSAVDNLLSVHGLQLRQSEKLKGSSDYFIAPVERGARKKFYDILCELDANKKAKYKHIPHEYIFSSIEQRRAILNGLIDTDGTVNQNGVVEYCTISEQLAKDIKLLCETLGYIVRWKYVPNNYYTKEKGSAERISAQPVYFLTIYTDDILGLLPRKQEKQKNRRKLRKVHRVHNITYVGEKECTCISIDAPSHLYLIEGCIPTHNTSFAVNMVMAYYLHVVLCLKDPHKYFGLEDQKKITFALLNIVTKTIAYKNAWGMLHKALLQSPFFMEYGIKTESKNPEWQCTKKPVDLIYGSTADHLIGLDILCCLTGDTTIKTVDGLQKLEDLVGKLIQVPTFNIETGEIQESQVCTVAQTKYATELIEVELENGAVIKCTPEHKLLLETGEYKRADELLDTDELAEQSL